MNEDRFDVFLHEGFFGKLSLLSLAPSSRGFFSSYQAVWVRKHGQHIFWPYFTLTDTCSQKGLIIWAIVRENTYKIGNSIKWRKTNWWTDGKITLLSSNFWKNILTARIRKPLTQPLKDTNRNLKISATLATFPIFKRINSTFKPQLILNAWCCLTSLLKQNCSPVI